MRACRTVVDPGALDRFKKRKEKAERTEKEIDGIEKKIVSCCMEIKRLEKAVVSSPSGTTPAVVGQKIGDTGFEKVTAKVVYDIYKIVLKADDGIADIYLNGQAMFYGLVNDVNNTGGYYYAYTATVSAGEYKVTYTLKNGWSGEAKLTGKNVTGTSFKATRTPASGQDFIPLVYQLSRVEKSRYVEPVTPSEDNGDDGLTITDYLLIVLIVRIVIMAVIVAMRLMRS